MAYKVIILYRLYMPSYFLGTFTEYPGFKLRLICNERGELLSFMITPADVDDRKPLEYKYFVEFVYGKLVGDKGYFLSFYSKIISFSEKIDQI